MSGKTQFRSPTGCCICGTKSSSSRFTPSRRFSQHFEGCFGKLAKTRNGDLCNACVLCVKRWLNQPWTRRELSRFSMVVDSKQGTGPKHMKQITKQRRRREALLAREQKPITENSYVSSFIQSNSKETYGDNRHDDVRKTSGNNKSMDNSPSLTSCNNNNNNNGIGDHVLNGLNNSTNGINHSINVNGTINNRGSSSSSSLCDRGEPDKFRAPEPLQGPPKCNRYRRQSQLIPVKIPNNEQEIDQLLREIMAQNSEAVNFDCREMHMAVQNRLRLRNRIVETGISISNNTAASSSTGSQYCNSSSNGYFPCESSQFTSNTDQQSVSSGSFGSSVGKS